MNIHGELHASGRDLRRAEVLEILRDAAVSRGKVVRLERPHVGEAHARALAHRGVDVRHGSLRRKSARVRVLRAGCGLLLWR